MKKKIAAVALLSMLVAGTVHASSINGEYKGYSIVNVKVNGTNVSSDVPAVNMDGTTLIPLRSVSESLGGVVTWDQNTYTANIAMSTQQTYSFFLTYAKSYAKAVRDNLSKSMTISDYSINIDERGVHAHAVYQLNNADSANQDLGLIAAVSVDSQDVLPFEETVIEVVTNGKLVETVSIKTSDTKDFAAHKTTFDQYFYKWDIKF